jgi:hypothetical protein
MKQHITIAVMSLACHSVAFGEPLSREAIQRAVDKAAKEYLGDFPPGMSITTHRQYFYGSVSRDLRDEYLSIFESFPATREFFRLPVARPSASEMLLVHPTSLESFVSP